MTPQITTAQQIKDIIEPIPANKFVSFKLGSLTETSDDGCSCFIGHINRHLNPSGLGCDSFEGHGARELTKSFLKRTYGINADGATVNNSPAVNCYNEPEIKDRVMHMINDMIAAGY